MTLVEALVGVALLGGLLATLVVSAGRLRAQTAAADARTDACRMADGLLNSWWADPASLPRDDAGELDDGWRWRTQTVREVAVGDVEASVVALTIVDPAWPDRPAARVEVLLVDELEEDE